MTATLAALGVAGDVSVVHRTSDLVVRTAQPGDHATIRALNNAAIPHVNALTPEQFTWLTETVDHHRVAVADNVIAGFVMALRNGTEYWSGNYAWFGGRFDAFLYLDRVVVAPDFRRRGIGSTLYADLIAFAASRWPRIVLEVNLDPPNPGSSAFHEALGFRRVGIREHPGGMVDMLELPLNATSSAPRGGSRPG